MYRKEWCWESKTAYYTLWLIFSKEEIVLSWETKNGAYGQVDQIPDDNDSVTLNVFDYLTHKERETFLFCPSDIRKDLHIEIENYWKGSLKWT